MGKPRREFIKKSAIGTAGITIGSMGMTAKSYVSIPGAYDKIRVGILDFSNRFKGALGKAFLKYAGQMNFEFLPCATSGTAAFIRNSIRRDMATGHRGRHPYHNQSRTLYPTRYEKIVYFS